MAQQVKQADEDREDTTVTNVGDGPEKLAGPSAEDLADAKPVAKDAGGGRPARREDKSSAPGFFTIYKKGQGKWTRLGTGLAAALIIGLTVAFLYQQLPIWLRPAIVPTLPESMPAEQRSAAIASAEGTVRAISLGVCAAVLAGAALLAWRLMNKPEHADFLIATDSEMKKVNWTSRRELIGSTKVVILFMFLIAAILFLIDILFGYVFYAINVLKAPPF